MPGDVFQFGRRYCLCYFIWISLPLLSPVSSHRPVFSFSSGSSGLFSRETWILRRIVRGFEEWGRGGIREARRRLVRRGTLSLKYPEVFFPRNCRSPSFLGSLNGPGYPRRIEKLPPHSISLSFLSPLSLSLVSTCPFCSPAFFSPFLLAKQFITRLHLANSRPLLDDDKAPRALRTRPILHAQPRVSENILHCPRVKNHKEQLRNTHRSFRR